ncbi:MAG: SAM-dependent methyltransferase, partial [Chloroflexi bacterium]|nr:SAM-dependent methyltransferase [Chloroflexota bacterium]
WDLLRETPDRYIYPAVRHGVSWDIYANDGRGSPLDSLRVLPAEIADGVNAVSKRTHWNKPAPGDYALPTEIWREVVARRTRCEEVRQKLAAGEVRDINDLITLNLDIRQFAQDVIVTCQNPALLAAFWHAINSITVLDPTGGSGAFVFAALNILEPLYEACLDRMEAFLAEWGDSGSPRPSDGRGVRGEGRQLHPNYHKEFTEVLARVAQHPNRRYFVLKTIIVNNLYAVDIMEEATEICKLRLFLKLAAQIDPDPTKDNLGIEPLPDIDFNIRTGNTLVGYATAEEVRRCMKSEKTKGHDQMKLGVMGEKDAYAAFEDKLQIADAAFRSFREQQTKLGGAVTAQDKANLKARLKSLEDELNRYLARDYGVKVDADSFCNPQSAFRNWLRSHQPFHWLIEFYGIISKGGFDVIIGNPPYVEMSDIAGQYSVRNLALTETGNLYAVCVERFAGLLHGKGKIGVIVPISSVSTPRMLPLMRVLRSEFSPLYLSHFAVRPGKLFVGVDMNLTIIVGQRVATKSDSVIVSTAYNRWGEQSRAPLFQTLTYAGSTLVEGSSAIPKVGSLVARTILDRIAVHGSLARLRGGAAGSERIFYHSGGRYFRKCIRAQLSNEYKELCIRKGVCDAVICLLSSSFYYWFWIALSDCYHVTKRDIDAVPVPESLLGDESMQPLADKLLCDLWKHAEKRLRNRADGSQREEVNFYVGESKPILDEIDRVLARHYGFTAEELDFILNYDIKYRLGRDAEGGEE